MARLDDFTLPVQLFLRAYPWRRIDPIPWAPPRRPLAESRVALISSAGLVLPGQERFDESVRGGDVSFRVLPGDTEVAALIDTHRSGSFDHKGLRRDPNLGFPLDRLRELAAAGRIGEVAPRHLSFMGSITAPGRLTRDSAPAMADLLVEDQVDVALLVPVWPMCNQAVSLVSAEIERRGIATGVIQLLREVAERVRPPRALWVPFPHGYPLDTPGDPARQRAVLEALLGLIERPGPPPVLEDYRP